MFRRMNLVAAGSLVAAGGLFLYLTFAPSGLGGIFGDDEFEPFPAGAVFLVMTFVGAYGVATWSAWRWLGIAITLLGLVFWVPFVLNTTPLGPSPAFVALYAMAAVALGFNLWREPSRIR
jgi:hypothetical protein